MTLSAVLLAGGESRRMGRDKATILFDGAPLWQKQLQLLRKLEPKEIFVSARTDPPWRPGDLTFVGDTAPSRGPLSGITTALSHLNTDHLLGLAIDMPFMSDSYLRRLCEDCQPGRGVVPMIDNRAEPLAAIYPREALADFQKALSGDDFSLQSIVARLIAAGNLTSVSVSKEEEALFRNLNELRDFAES